MNKKLYAFLFLLLAFTITGRSFNTFREFSDSIEVQINEGSMGYIKNQECIISSYLLSIKNQKTEYLKLSSLCRELKAGEEINWDYPGFSETKVIYVYGEDMIHRIRNNFSSRKMSFSFKHLAFYRKDHPKYKKSEYYYYEPAR